MKKFKILFKSCKFVHHSREEEKMSKENLKQRKRVVTNYIYATLIGLLVIACAVTIALVQTKKTNNLAEIGAENEVQVSASVFVLPMQNATVIKDYSGAELQYNDTLKQWEIHKAIDFMPNGDDLTVYSIGAGTVSNVYTNYLEGTVVEISHEDGLVSVYKSLASDVTVKVGDKVSAGTAIGQVSTSMAQELNSGAHLHLEILKNGTKVDPNDYLSLADK